jgi:hypothetical protein
MRLVITATIIVYDNSRDEAEAIMELAEDALDNQRLSMTVNDDKYAGVLQVLSRIDATHEDGLEKWYGEATYEGRFLKRSS